MNKDKEGQNNGLFAERRILRHPDTNDLGTFVRFENHEAVFATKEGREFITHSTDGTWNLSSWKSQTLEEYRALSDPKYSFQELEEIENIRLNLALKADEIVNKYKEEQNSLKLEAEVAIVDTILQWKLYESLYLKIYDMLDDLCNKKLIYNRIGISFELDHHWPRRLLQTQRLDRQWGKPPFRDEAHNIHEARNEGRQDMERYWMRYFSEPEIWEAELVLQREKHLTPNWSLQLYREPKIKTGWGAAFGGSSIWREMQIPVNTDSVDMLLNQVHPSVFIRFADQIKRGLLDGPDSPLEKNIKKSRLT